MRSRPRSSIGLGMRNSTTVITIAASTPTTPHVTTSGELHPECGPSLSVYTISASAEADSAKPAMSKRPVAGCRCSWRCRQPNHSATRPIGKLTRKIHRQLMLVTIKPPSTGPSAGAASVGIMISIAARARSAGGKARKSIARPTGVSIPPPMPWITRKAISWPIVCAAPHSSEPHVNAIRANKNTRLVPNRSPSQPDVGIHTARLSV